MRAVSCVPLCRVGVGPHPARVMFYSAVEIQWSTSLAVGGRLLCVHLRSFRAVLGVFCGSFRGRDDRRMRGNGIVCLLHFLRSRAAHAGRAGVVLFAEPEKSFGFVRTGKAEQGRPQRSINVSLEDVPQVGAAAHVRNASSSDCSRRLVEECGLASG